MPSVFRAADRLRLLRHPAFLAGLLALASLPATLDLHLHERLGHALRSGWPGTAVASGVGLERYRAALQHQPLAGVSDNLSGLGWDDARGQLWAVVNNPETLLALSPEGEVLARYPLQGFTDVEGVTYLGDDLLLLAEERDQRLVIIRVPTTPGTLTRPATELASLSLGQAGNAGFEGLGYDARTDRLFVVNERAPRKLYEVRGLKRSLQSGLTDLAILDRSAWLDGIGMATDLSSVHVDSRSGHLLLLSDEARLLIELDGEGKLVSYRSLRRGFAGLERTVPQAEGMTFDEQGRLYLVSEPNLFYRFERSP